MDAALQEMVDARAIEQLMIRYIDRVDANDPVGAAACFAEDGLTERDRRHPGHPGRLPGNSER